MTNKHTPIVIIGAGPAGLSAAYEVLEQGEVPLVLEKYDNVGGIARTESYKGYHFDVGGHRFYTKIEKIHQLWHAILGEDFLEVVRMSRIYYRGKFFNYPLRPLNALSNLGIFESLLIVLSYLHSQISPYPQETTFEHWVANRFGKRLYTTFFKTYTEKVWGIPCHQIRADWAAQRIKGLSLRVALSNALFGNNTTKSLIDTFHYPLRGPGMMWQRFREVIESEGGRVLPNAEVISLKQEQRRITRITYREHETPVTTSVENLISSMPISELVSKIIPAAPDKVLEAANKLSYRAFVIVILILNKQNVFPDQWIYVHSPGVKVGRIQNFRNWSAAMVPDHQTTSVGMEYFCNEGDELWTMSDTGLTDLAAKELAELGLAEVHEVIDTAVLRQPKAYPVYDYDYQDHLHVIQDFLATIDNLQTIGRNGMHRYNNQDHSMLTGILAAQNIFGAHHDLWKVNDEEEYLEEDRQAKLRQLLPEKILIRTFARMDKLAFAIAIGTVIGLLMFFITLLPVITQNEVLFPILRLLGQYFIGYTVTIKGAFLVFGYSFCWGLLFGWLFAYLRNFFLAFYIYQIKKKAEVLSLRDFLDHI